MAQETPLLQITIHRGVRPGCTCIVDPPQALNLLKLLEQSRDERIRSAQKIWQFCCEQERLINNQSVIDTFDSVSLTYERPDGIVERLPQIVPYRVARTFMFAVGTALQLRTDEPIERLKSDIASFVVCGKSGQSNPFFMVAADVPVAAVV